MEVTQRITVNQSIDTLWHILAVDFANLGEWTTTVDSSRLHQTLTVPLDNAPIAGRVCSAPAFGDITETITRYDEQNKVLSYTAEGGGLLRIVDRIENIWSLRSFGGDTTEVSTRVVAHLTGVAVLLTPLMNLQIRHVGAKALEELKYYAETGTIHPRKVKALHKAGRNPVTM